ncbi:MAG: hypothetical protein ACE5HE_02260 [Phycisphaerae bacterium]
MGFITCRAAVIGLYLIERARFGTPELVGAVERDVLFVLDGVGRFQVAPLTVRRIIRKKGIPMASVLYDWQFGITGEIWTDLMWRRRNRLMAAKLARRLLAFRRAYPHATIHVLAFSGGAGIALFACEQLRGRHVVETMVLACPAVSPDYDLTAALRCVTRCYALVSPRDRFILGLGTRIFGTTDRRFTASAGYVGFRRPRRLSPEAAALYARMRQIAWTPALRDLGHHGGHTGWVSERFLARHLFPMLRGAPLLATSEVPSCEEPTLALGA